VSGVLLSLNKLTYPRTNLGPIIVLSDAAPSTFK
jgi:hypothetical protein